VVYVHPGKHYGREAAVLRHLKDKIEIVFVFNSVSEPQFCRDLLREIDDSSYEWVDFHTAAEMVGVSVASIQRVTSSLKVMGRDLGMNLRRGNQNLETIGYLRKRIRWEISTKCVEEIKLYFAFFPMLFQQLDTVTEMIKETHLFPGMGKEKVESELNRIVEWLGNLPMSGARRVLSGSLIASSVAVKELQKVFFFF
jgi:hypothetical protein